MAKEITLTAECRTGSGSAEARRMRRQGWVPAAVNRENGATELLKLNRHDFEYMLRHHTSEHLVVRLSVTGQSDVMVLLREVQHHVRDGGVLHADFGEVSMTRKMQVTIPILLAGEPDGVKNQGGVLEQLMRELEVECLPGDVVDSFEVDVSALRIGDILAVSAIHLADLYTVLSDADATVATVISPRVETEETVAEESAEVEPEVIGRSKKEQEEEA